MRSYNTWVQHIINPLHVYCRLIDWGVSRRLSKRLGILYERYVYQLLSIDLKKVWNLSRRRSW